MNAIARYLLVFLLGWSGAVWSYSDLIYKTKKVTKKTENPQKTNDIFLPDAPKLRSTVTSELNSINTEQNPPAIAPRQEQSLEEQKASQ